MPNPVQQQEDFYTLPYHWFPEQRLKKFEREEKQRLVFNLLTTHCLQPVTRYLDVGCGDGRWTADIHRFLGQPIQTTGVDFSERAIRFARLITPEIDFQLHQGEALPFAESSFDLVTAIEVLEHVEDRSERLFLHELRRVLTKNGLLILTTPSWNLQLARHHFRHYSVERLTELIEENGFAVLAVRGQSIPCYGYKRKLRKRMNLFPWLWKLWKFSYRESSPDKSLNLIIAARPV